MSSPDDTPGPSKSHAKKREKSSSRSSSIEFLPDRPAASNGHGSATSPGSGYFGGRSPSGGRSPVGGRSPAVGSGPSNMRDRLLVANALARELSLSSGNEDSASSSSPRMNGEENGGAMNGKFLVPTMRF